MKILFIADVHIKLGQRKIPIEWNVDRFHKLFDELSEVPCDKIIIGGDLLDASTPSTSEVALMFDLLAKLKVPTEILSGNHEMLTKTKSVLEHLSSEISRCNPLVSVIGSIRSKDYDVISYEDLHKKWAPQESKLCFTHVRAELPKHMKTEPEIDLSKFDIYDLVVAGDLHDHKMSQTTEAGTPIIYPGSPLSTSFHREIPETCNGYLIIDTKELTTEWHDLGHLPQLIRKKVTSEAEMVEDAYHRVVYEIEGDIGSLGKVKNSDLLDKKLNTKVSTEATLQLEDKTTEEELDIYLTEVEGLDEETVVRLSTRFSDAISTTDI